MERRNKGAHQQPRQMIKPIINPKAHHGREVMSELLGSTCNNELGAKEGAKSLGLTQFVINVTDGAIHGAA
jgi:hypothetical protein